MTMDAMPLDLAHAWSAPINDRDMFRPTTELRAWQEEMKQLLRRQRQRGGVINHDECNDDVIDETWVRLMYFRVFNSCDLVVYVTLSCDLVVYVTLCSHPHYNHTSLSKDVR